MKKIALMIAVLFMAISIPLQASAASLFEVRQLIKNYYYGEVDGDIYDAKSIDELMTMLKDPYTLYMTKEQYRKFNQSIEQETVGIGIVYDTHEKGVLIQEVMKNSPAESAGLKAGDVITTADGVSLGGMPIQNVITYITGAENTTVKLTILRQDGSSKVYSIVRKVFQAPNVTTSLLAGNVGYIYFASYSDYGAEEVSNAIGTLKNKGATSFIFDIRDNGGGYVDTAEEIIGLFPNAKSAYMLHNASGVKLVNAAIGRYNKFPSQVSLLVNGFSASASDMTAAAVKDQKLAKIYGSTTYGKGTMQLIWEFNDGSALKVTNAEFRSPNDNVIKNVGVKPDIETTTPLEDAHYDFLINSLTNYKQLSSLTNVSTAKTFKLKLTHAVNEKTVQNAIELIELGGQKVDITTTVSSSTVTIIPNEKLKAGGHYALIVHPLLKNQNAKTLKQGSYMRISVKK